MASDSATNAAAVDTLDGVAIGDAPLIRVRGVVNRFGEQCVHDGVDLDVRRGEILGVVGGSGTGKSVLMRSILGLRRPNAGRIQVLGVDAMAEDPVTRRHIERNTGVLFHRRRAPRGGCTRPWASCSSARHGNRRPTCRPSSPQIARRFPFGK